MNYLYHTHHVIDNQMNCGGTGKQHHRQHRHLSTYRSRLTSVVHVFMDSAKHGIVQPSSFISISSRSSKQWSDGKEVISKHTIRE